MVQNAYIKLVPASLKQTVTIEDVKDLFHYYKEITNKTSTQLNWEFDKAVFPYELKNDEAAENWFYLKATDEKYSTIYIGIDTEDIHNIATGETNMRTYIQVMLPKTATHGDKGKANEFCKFLSKKLKAELHLFNGRVMHFYKR